MKTLAIGIVALATGANAYGINCGPREEVVSYLGERFGEERQFLALSHLGVMTETFANLDTGTWTLVETASPDAPSCMVGHGGGFVIDLGTQGT